MMESLTNPELGEGRRHSIRGRAAARDLLLEKADIPAYLLEALVLSFRRPVRSGLYDKVSVLRYK